MKDVRFVVLCFVLIAVFFFVKRPQVNDRVSTDKNQVKKQADNPIESLQGMSLKVSDDDKSLEALNEELKALFKAVQSGDLEFVKNYLELGGDPNAVYGEDKMSLLGAASYHGNNEILKLLLSKGADSSYVDERGNSVLMLSFLQDKDKEIYKELMDVKLDFNHENKKGKTALSMAVKSFNESATTALLENEGLSDVNLQKSFFESVLNQDESFMGLIHDKFSYAITLEDEAGEDALKRACREGLIDSLSFLMSHQPDNQKNKIFLEELLEFAKTENMKCYDFLTSA